MGWPTKRKRKLRVEQAPRRSWLPGQKGQGGEGLSHGYGGSVGMGIGASGPQTRPNDTAASDDDVGDESHSPSLPSREHLARVLR